jgi:hypothetical protein
LSWPSASINTATTLGTVSAPTGFVNSGSAGDYLSGGKHYADQSFAWDNPGGYPWELWEFAGASVAVNPDAGAFVVDSGASGGASTITKLIPPSGAGGTFTYWVRFTVPLSDYATPVTVTYPPA